jgi:hypothetical protein
MASHVSNELDLSSQIPANLSMPLQVAFQTATPIFVVLFGAMLEVVYLPRWNSGKRSSVASRLLQRALQCWALYAISIFVLFIVDDKYSLAFSISCILFMGNSPYTEILKFYAIALAIAPILLWARERLGLAPLIALAFTYQAAWPLLDALPDAQNDLGLPLQAARLLDFVTGFGRTDQAGPSVLHGLTLVVAGQCLGHVLLGRRDEQVEQDSLSINSRAFSRRLSVLLAWATGLMIVGTLILPRGTFSDLADMSLRMRSHTLYFSVGIGIAFFMTLAFVWIVDVKSIVNTSTWSSLAFFGRTSMFTFAWGNILLYIVDYEPATLIGVYAFACLLLTTICTMSLAFDRIMRGSELARAALVAVNKPLDHLAQALLTRALRSRWAQDS